MKIKRLPSGNYNTLVYSHTEIVDGKKKRIYESFTDPDKRVVAQKAAQFALERSNRGNHMITVGQAYDRYISSKSAVLSPTTIREYKRSRKSDLQELMDIPLGKLTQETVQAAINDAAVTHSAKTVRNMHGLLASVLKQYYPQLVLNTKLPQRERKEVKIPTEAEISAIYAVVKDTAMEIPFLLASQLGMRASEIAALQIENLDFEKNTVAVTQALVWDGSQWVLKQPKSYSGTRTIPCHKNIMEIIKSASPHHTIIQGKSFVVGLTTVDISHRWVHVLKKTQIEYFNFHALRHYFASQALLQGLPKKYIVELMGHSSEQMLNDVYAHTFSDEKNKMAHKMIDLSDKLFNP